MYRRIKFVYHFCGCSINVNENGSRFSTAGKGKKEAAMTKSRRPLTKKEIGEFRKLLLEKREEIWKEIRTELKSRVSEEYHGLINDVNDEQDLAQIDLQEEVVLGVLETRKKELEAISQALWRIEHGEYGRCIECEDWICTERLKVRPWAVYCIPCKERLEKLGKV